MVRFLRRFRDAFRGRELDRDLRQQMASHIAEATEDFVREGLSPEEARRAAQRRFGNIERVEEAWREARSFVAFEYVARDVRHALRTLGRTPGFAVTVVSVLSIGTAAVTCVFTLLNSVVLRPLPYPDAERLVVIRHAAPGLGLAEAGLSSALYWIYAEGTRSLESIAVYREPLPMNLRRADAGTERITVTYASARLFQVLRATPALGRLFTEQDGRPGFMNMRWRIPVLLSHDFWISHFGGDPGAIGETVVLNETEREIVGVLPPGFTFPDADTDIWMLLEPSKSDDVVRSLKWSAAARMRPQATATSVTTDLADLVADLSARDADAARAQFTPLVIPMKFAVIGDVSSLIWLLFGAMTLLLLVTCASTGVLFLVRAEHRAHEMAVRRSLGAHGPHLMRLFFIESFVLTGAAAVLSLIAAHAFAGAVGALVPFDLPRATEIRIDTGVMSLTIALATALAAFYGGMAVRRQRHSPGVTLRGGHSATGATRSGRFGTDLLLVVQVTLAVSLLVGAILMVQTSRNLVARTPGFSPDNVITIEIGLPGRKASQHSRIYRAVVQRVRQFPGVSAAAAASFVPLAPTPHLFAIEGTDEPIPFKFFLPGYFQTVQTPVIDGATFAEGERVTVAHPVLISATLARRLFPGGRAVGRTLRRLDESGHAVEMVGGEVPRFTIAGVVADVHEESLRAGPTEIVYVPVMDPPVEQVVVPTTMRLVIRSTGSVRPLVGAVRQAVAALDPTLSVGRIEALAEIVAGARAREVFVARLLAVTAALSLLLGAVAVYGTVAQVVGRRTREIGIRLALGATRGDVVRLVTRGTLRVVVIGAASGTLAAAVGAGVLRSLLFGVDAYDPGVFLTAVCVLAISTAAAALLAARRGTALPPLLALRGDD